MRLLLDSHAFLWFVLDDDRLGSEALKLIEDPANELVLSMASIWEIGIKVAIGKYSVAGDFAEFVVRETTTNGLSVLAVEVEHVAAMVTLPFHHRDPFDRLLIAQAVVENLPLLSADSAFDAYGVTRHWT